MSRLLLAAIVMLCCTVPAASAAEPVDPQTFAISGSEVKTLRSKTLGRTYDLYIKLPPGYDAEKNSKRLYPVVYLNDGGYCWLTAVGVTRAPFNLGGYEKAILIGLSYAWGEDGFDSRTRDLTPTKAQDWSRVTGGAKDYLNFLKNEVLPVVETNFRADPQRRMLVGQSFGGLFGAYALLEEPGLFQDYVLTSPSLWFDNEVLFELQEQVAKKGTRLSGRVYSAVGETETPAINSGRHDMVGQQAEFAHRLRSLEHKDLIVKDEVIPEGTHLTTFPIGFTRALRWLLPGEKPFAG